MFPRDNNGSLIVLQDVQPKGAMTADGALIFGIKTQADNDLDGAKIYTTDSNGLITTTFQGIAYPGFLDSGSNGIFFLDSALPDCTIDQGFYCPQSTTKFTSINTGTNNISGYASFSIANIENLTTDNPNFTAFDNIGGPFPGYFDYGLPFFFGRTIFTGIEGQSTGNVCGPFFAY
jgi:hypothetical protein